MYSKLVSHVNISPNKTYGRNHKIDTITIHCVVGQLTVESLGQIFKNPNRQASSNYGVGRDGRIGCYVEEHDRSWCSSSRSNDNRAITIEVASDTKPPYKINSKAWAGLIDLLVDICKRNNIDKLKWRGDKSLIGQVNIQNMTAHRWFANTDCPGDYLYSRFGKIADEVNARLSGDKKPDSKDSFLVRVSTPNLNIRQAPTTDSKIKGQVIPGVYTIVDVVSGKGSKSGWGKLKSGVGYISLDYVSHL